MTADSRALQLLFLTFSCWVNGHLLKVIEYLVEENLILKEKLGGECPSLTNDQRRRLAARAMLLGRNVFDSVTTVVTPDTLPR